MVVEYMHPARECIVCSLINVNLYMSYNEKLLQKIKKLGKLKETEIDHLTSF